MDASHSSSTINQYLSYFGYSSSEIDDLLNLSPDQNDDKGWLEFEPGQTNINSNSSSLSKKQTVIFRTEGSNFKAITKRFSLKQGEKIKSASITNIKGKLIQNLSGALNSQGENILSWNARNKQGRAVSAGTYILKIVGTKTEKAVKFMLQK
jgi:flagellar hook assembly protein FlgD